MSTTTVEGTAINDALTLAPPAPPVDGHDIGQQKALAKLREPFAADQISKLPKVACYECSQNRQRKHCDNHSRAKCEICNAYISTAHIHLDYVGHADLTARLLDADPMWTWEPLAFDERGLPAFDNIGGLWIRLTVAGVTRLGYGDAQGKQGNNAVKEAIGDALRNAAMRFGAALDLWSKSERSEPRAESEHRPQATRSGGKPKAQTKARQQTATPRADVDPETGEIPEPPSVTDAIAKLDQEGRRQLEERRQKANFPPVDKLPTAAARQMVRWAEEIAAASDKGRPFADDEATS